MVEKVNHGGGEALDIHQGDAQQKITDMRQTRIGEHALEFVLEQSNDRHDDHGHGGQRQQDEFRRHRADDEIRLKDRKQKPQ